MPRGPIWRDPPPGEEEEQIGGPSEPNRETSRHREQACSGTQLLEHPTDTLYSGHTTLRLQGTGEFYALDQTVADVC